MAKEIIRKQYRGSIAADFTDEEVMEALAADKAAVSDFIEEGSLKLAGLYRHESMVFLYLELTDESLLPDDILPEFSMCLDLWPEQSGLTPWAPMYHIYHHDVPGDGTYWHRTGKKQGRGRIARLVSEDKLFSYVYWHKQIVDEGLLVGDKFQCIALHENLLFCYDELPREHSHIRKDVDADSQVIAGWEAADPASHFDHDLAGADNFLVIDELMHVGGWEH